MSVANFLCPCIIRIKVRNFTPTMYIIHTYNQYSPHEGNHHTKITFTTKRSNSPDQPSVFIRGGWPNVGFQQMPTPFPHVPSCDQPISYRFVAHLTLFFTTRIRSREIRHRDWSAKKPVAKSVFASQSRCRICSSREQVRLVENGS